MVIPSDEGPVLLLRFVRKDRSLLMQALAWVLAPLLGGREAFMRQWWTTLGTTIYYPVDVEHPHDHPMVEHEAVHALQFQRWGWLALGLLYVLPLPVLLSGRWWIERPAYLVDILAGRRTPEQAADILWGSYLWPWPRPWMLRWFEKKVQESRQPTT